MEIPPDKRWIPAVIAPLRAHGYAGESYNRLFDAIARDEDEKGTNGARRRAESVVTALLFIVTNGILPMSDEEHARREGRLREIHDRQRKLERVHRFVIEITGDHKLPRVVRKRAGQLVPLLEELGAANEVGP